MAATAAKRTRPARESRVRETRTATYRLYPTVRQDGALEELLLRQRRVYNAALEERRGAWRVEKRSVTRF